MALVKYIKTDCRAKTSEKCSGTFMRKLQRGRPQLDCTACKANRTTPAKAAVQAAQEITQGICPCGNTFEIKPGRGRKPSKCQECRDAGTVYRANEDGELEAIRAEALAEEQREIREQAGKERAAALFDMMAPLLKSTRERKVIVH
jgi:hypothetical protein